MTRAKSKLAAAAGGVALLAAQLTLGAQTQFGDAAEITRFLHDNFEGKKWGMVIGVIDERGAKVFSAGGRGKSGTNEVNGDTLFEIGSITKTFTVLLLQDMVQRGEMKLDDPVSMYLPAKVRMPAYKGREITLLNLAAQDSGLPFDAEDSTVQRFNAYSADDLYSFLSGYKLKAEPGIKFQYSNVGLALLGLNIALKAGTNYEALVLDRICRPLHMDATCFQPGPQLKAREAQGYRNGKRAPYFDLHVMAPTGGLKSTANDLLKYLAANLGLTPSSLTPLMEKMQVIRHCDSPELSKTAMPWFDEGSYNPPGTELLGHPGGTPGFSTFIGFDLMQRRGVVVLSSFRAIHGSSVGWRLLQCAPLNGMDATKMLPIREFVGTGISIELDKESHEFRITKVYPNTSAARAGLLQGLIVTKINGIALGGKSLEDFLRLSHGEAGSKVQYELAAADRSQTNTVELMREKFLIPF